MLASSSDAVAMADIEKGFSLACKLVLGRELFSIQSYEKWLWQDVPVKVSTRPSALSGQEVHVPQIDFYDALGGNVLAMAESLEHGEKGLSAADVERLSLGNAAALLGPIRLASPEVIDGENFGTLRCADYGPSASCFSSAFCFWAKHNAYSFWPKLCEYVYGCSTLYSCKFCIHCHAGSYLNRCFETSDCVRCEDCYFSHNLENCSNCLFCFNTKAKRYAVFNHEVGLEAYMKIRKAVLASVADELEKTHALRHTIFNLGIVH